MKERRKMSIVSFTPGGRALAERIQSALAGQEENGWQAWLFHKPSPLKDWCQEQFACRDALLFIGAMGIAVRAVAPFLEDKTTDPAVLALDEKGRYVISVLCGHLGGGNELCRKLAKMLGAQPVITTASDVNGKIAVDVFAKKNNLVITDMGQAKAAAAAIVAGEKVFFFCDGPVRGSMPLELTQTGVQEPAAEEEAFCICVTAARKPFHPRRLCLIPKAYVLGIGCKAGKTMEEIEALVCSVLSQEGIAMESVAAAATVDLKKEEAGLLEFCEKYHLPVCFYSAGELAEVPGDYASSAFVAATAGVDNVCERAAVRRVLEESPYEEKKDYMKIKKTKGCGVTMALARRDWSVRFE